MSQSHWDLSFLKIRTKSDKLVISYVFYLSSSFIFNCLSVLCLALKTLAVCVLLPRKTPILGEIFYPLNLSLLLLLKSRISHTSDSDMFLPVYLLHGLEKKGNPATFQDVYTSTEAEPVLNGTAA